MIMIRTPRSEEWDLWHALDPDLPLDRFERKVRDRQGYVLFADGEATAVLRFSLFLDRIPYCTRLAVDDRFRGLHLGLALLSQWEQDMLQRGYDAAMVSARSGEGILDFYRRAGYHDAGRLAMDIPGHEGPEELFLTKRLLPGCACERAKENRE